MKRESRMPREGRVISPPELGENVRDEVHWHLGNGFKNDRKEFLKQRTQPKMKDFYFFISLNGFMYSIFFFCASVFGLHVRLCVIHALDAQGSQRGHRIPWN